MKFNKYQLAAAGIAVVIIVIVVFTQRSDWDANKYILSADDAGNLNPVSESYFDNKEKELKNEVKSIKKMVEGVSGLLWQHPIKLEKMFGPHNGATCLRGSIGHRPTQCLPNETLGCSQGISCPGGTYAITAANGYCNCASLTMRM